MIGPNTLLQNRYLVLNQIGQGGMGAVYIATDQRFGSTVALKETFFDDAGLRKAFEREARLLNHLRHPALPRVSDHFMEEEGQFLVMEYIAGDDLAEKLKERGGAFPLSEVLNWADQLLDALDYLHTQEPPVIHRDIKPQNLKLTPRNHIVLLDFGLAKGTPAMQMSKVTATGSVFGYSRHYASLEQIQGTGTDPRSDLYSLAATLYHLMTGNIPTDALTRAAAVLNGQPDPLRSADEVHAQVTPAVAEVLNQAMSQNASLRPQTAAAMRESLREAARQGHSVARDTNAQAAPTTDVYEQETQLIYAAAPGTKAIKDANKTGTAKKDDGATVADAASPSVVAASRTNIEPDKAEPDSVVTKVAAAATKNQSRRRAIGIAASAAVLIGLAAVVYTFTRNSSQTPATNQSVQSAPVANPTVNQNSATPVATPAEEAVIEPTPSDTPVARAPVPTKPTKETQAPTNPKEESAQEDEDTDPPETPETPERGRPRPGTPEFEEAMRDAAERRREAEELRRQAQEQRREILRRQRLILEAERRRRQQQQQQQQLPPPRPRRIG
ncbi:MAG TPA: protein kinase [Pyrinomonadaceae bacterium]